MAGVTAIFIRLPYYTLWR